MKHFRETWFYYNTKDSEKLTNFLNSLTPGTHKFKPLSIK